MLVFVAIAMVTMMGFLALTIDIGAGGRQRRIAQTAADAGAIGGAAEIFKKNWGLISGAALAEAVRNGFAAGEVTVNYPPATGPHAGDNAYVEVLIDKTLPSIFGSFFSVASMNVRARAVAGVGSFVTNCIYSLDPDGPQAVEVTNGAELTTNCGITINSTDPNALDTHSSGTIDTQGGGIAIAGNWSGNKPPVPTPSTGTAPSVNPLSTFVVPTAGACTHTGKLTITKDTALAPGVYCGGLDVSSKSVTLSAGTYFFAGGGIHISNGGSLTGAGVTLINTIDVSGTYNFAPLDFGNGCKAQLSAPTAGDLKGMLMIGDPAGPSDVENTFACSSDVPPELTGTLYFPTQKITFNGSNTLTEISGSVIAKNVEISAKVIVTNPPSSSSTFQTFALVE
jgi:hypothetical protein